MSFEALASKFSLQFEDVPPEWAPLVFPFDPDLPLFPLLYFHVLAQDLNGQRPRAQDRAYGYIRTVRIDLDTRILTAEIVCNKDLSVPTNRDRFLNAVSQEVGHRLGVIDRVKINDVNAVFPSGSRFAGTIPVLREIWHHVVGRGYGGTLPFGRLWDRVLGLARFYASFYSPGRKSELIMTHYFCTRFGDSVASGSNVPRIDFYLFPTWEELTDPENPLALFTQFRNLALASLEVCRLPLFAGIDLAQWSYTGLTMPKGTKLSTEFYMDRIVNAAGQQHRTPLIDCFNAFDKGPPRTVMFLMFLNDVRQINSASPTPSGGTKARLNPAQISSPDSADIFLNLKGYQSKKVITIYAQQSHGNPHCFPIDTWIGAFLAHPMNVAEYDAVQGQLKGTVSNRSKIAALLGSGSLLGKVERLLWLTAQTRKIHSTVCNDALWCIKESAGFRARGANPLACKACHLPIRQVCPAYAAISGSLVSFNSSHGGARFNLLTSARNNDASGQRFERCVRSDGVTDEDTSNDWAQAFSNFPNAPHSGEPISVEDFIKYYC
jgi:hypothetical protein